jgi:2-oxoglutarate dehydrogenase E2 component (dihydrolipoamide succinyltransferase)
MTIELKLPDLGGDVKDVTITRWRVEEGAMVQAGDILLEVATDKVDTEVPAPATSRTLYQLVLDNSQ